MKTFYNLPEKIIYCKNCLMSNQRPNMCSEHYNTVEQKKLQLNFTTIFVMHADLMIKKKKSIGRKEKMILKDFWTNTEVKMVHMML